MRKKTFFILLAIGNMLTIEAQENKQTMNPFFQAYSTPFEVPPFDKIKNEHFKPAILEGIKKKEAEVEAIVNNKEAPTFDNTILAMENAGELLSNVNIVFSNLNGANTNDELQKIAKEISPNLAAHNDNIYLNEKLFARIKAVWDKRESLNLNLEQAKILENLHKAFVRSGANLSSADKDKLRKINAELSITALKYGQNILAETNKYELVISDKKDLSGLPQELINAAAEDAKAKGKTLPFGVSHSRHF